MKKAATIIGGLVVVAIALGGCARNSDTCAGGGEACKAKMAAGGTCCAKCGGPDAKPAK